jgi:hypothetical protein
MVSSGRVRAGIDDRPDVLATQRRGEPAGNEPFTTCTRGSALGQ